MKVKWVDREVEFLKNHYKNLTYKEIGNFLNRSYKSVSRKAEDLGLKKKENRLWTESENQFLLVNYNKIPPIKIAQILNRTYAAVINRAESLDLYVDYRYLKPSYNEEFFDKWSVELSWLVGIVLSDGCVFNKPNNRFVSIKMSDKDVLEKVKYATGYKNKIIELKPERSWYKTPYQIVFAGDKVWRFFRNLGMDNNKSHNAKFPSGIGNRFISHVIRGVLDGDGSISLSRNTGYPFVRVCGTRDVTDYITKYIGLGNTLHKNSDINYTIQYTGERALKFLRIIYRDSSTSIRMNRKYYKYKKALEWGNNGRVLC
mgnify:CR=1 FL=1